MSSTDHKDILQGGVEYLRRIVDEMEAQHAQMLAHAAQTHIEQVRAGYVRFAETLAHCIDVLKTKIAELEHDK